jgi:toxin CptA
MTSAPAIGFECHPSGWLRRALAIMAALAVLAVSICAMGIGFKLALIVAVLLATARALRILAASPLVAVGWSPDNGWTVRLAGGEDAAATLVSSRVLGGFVLLRLSTAERAAWQVLLTPDNSDADIRRRLRMRLATMQPGEAVPRI